MRLSVETGQLGWLLAVILVCGISVTHAQDQNGDTAVSDPETETLDQTEEVERDGNPDEIRRGVRMGGEDGKSRRQVYYERIIAKVEPSLKGDPERIPVYINLYKNELLSNPRLFAADVNAEWNGEEETLVLNGFVEYEENRISFEQLFHFLGFEKIENRVEVLPSEELGAERYAIVTAPMALAYDNAVEPRETMTEVMAGDPVFLLKPGEDGHYLAHASDGYVCYIDGAALAPVDGEAFHEWNSGEHALLLRDAEAGTGEEALVYPAGSRFRISGRDGSTLMLSLPGKDNLLSIDEKDVRLVDDTPDERALTAVRISEAKLGSDYVWGGKTVTGVDCSGLVQSAYQAQGINVARDAFMQAYAGKLVATRWYRQDLRAGDLLYFLGGTGRITHTAIYIGDGKYIEASGEVKYTSFNPGDENYSERRDEGFCFAKRLFE